MKQETIITSRGLSFWAYLVDLYKYRQLLWAFSYRNIRVKYAQTLAGVLWALINPLVSLLILGFVFGKVAKLDTQGVDPFLFAAVGLAAWSFVSSVVSWSGTMVINAQNMVNKIYFPRMIIPMSTALVGLIDLVIILLVVGILFLVNDQVPSQNLLYLPLFIIAVLLTGLCGGLWIAALSIRFRDFLHIIPYILRIGLYASPVAYSMNSVPVGYQSLFLFNPMTGLLEGLRWCFFGGIFPQQAFVIYLVWLLFLLLSGIWLFNRIEKTIADII